MHAQQVGSHPRSRLCWPSTSTLTACPTACPTVRRCPCSRSPLNIGELGDQVIVYPRQRRGNFLVHHSSLGSLGEMRRPSGFSIGGTWGQWRGRGGRKQELEDPEIVFPLLVTFVCFKVKVGQYGLHFYFFSFNFCPVKMFQSLLKHH